MSDELKAAMERLWLPAQHGQGNATVFASDLYVVLTALEQRTKEADAGASGMAADWNERKGLLAELDRQAKEKRAWNIEANTLRADLAKAQQALKVCEDLGISITVRPGSDGKDNAFSNTRAIAAEESLAKAQARCAELEAALRQAEHAMCGNGGHGCFCKCPVIDGHGPGCALVAALASDGTSALAAVRLAQRVLRDGPVWREHEAALKALDEVFGDADA